IFHTSIHHPSRIETDLNTAKESRSDGFGSGTSLRSLRFSHVDIPKMRKPKMIRKTFIVAALASSCMAAAAFAQTSPPEATTPAFIPSQAASEWRASTLIGTAVKSPSGEALGDINDVVVTQTGSVSAFIIGVGG